MAHRIGDRVAGVTQGDGLKAPHQQLKSCPRLGQHLRMSGRLGKGRIEHQPVFERVLAREREIGQPHIGQILEGVLRWRTGLEGCRELGEAAGDHGG